MTVTVRGRGQADCVADELAFSLVVTAVETTADAALARVAEREVTLREILDATGVPADGRTSSSATLAEEWDHRSNEPTVVGYRATMATTVRLTDPSTFGTIVGRAVLEATARLNGPWWRVLPENPGWLDACRMAAEDASSRARAYADALGVRLGSVVGVAEASTRERSGDAPGPVSVRVIAASAPDIELSAGKQVVTALVDVTFDILRD